MWSQFGLFREGHSMPVIELTITGHLRPVEVYVSGAPLSNREVSAIRRGHPDQPGWSYDAFFPRKAHLMWIVPLHAIFAAALYVTLSVNVPNGQFFSGSLVVAVVSGLGVVEFWDHILINRRTRILQRTRTIAYDRRNRLERRTDDRWEQILLLSYIQAAYYGSERTEIPERPEGFSDWLGGQLHEDAYYFGRVHQIVDNYICATSGVRMLPGLHRHTKEISCKLGAAGDAAFNLLLPIYRESEERRIREIEEADERKARESAFLATEESSLTKMRIKIAVEDIDAYVEGHKALAAAQPKV
ncbi:hypothetical protein A2791_01465 [Candidatus Saccharibacteria bacterium RIFCSPHIGHO2_01_FULL_46_30]|nr:MAG: hypothetical protein A2791_01465 [Candidatus Saccharibacteria bacterium RIFCSPHIGHO2_01_FULL_46_30]